VTSVKCRVAVLASGRGSNFRALAERCQNPTFPAEVVCLVTDDVTANAVSIAGEFGIAWHAVEPGERRGHLAVGAEARIVRLCEEAGVGLVVLAGFMRILDGELLEHFAGRIINIHPSLLPSFKGLNAQRQALEHGVKVAGCTVHFVDASLDGGPIILQAAVPVHDTDDLNALRARILAEEHRILARAVELFALGCLRVEGRRVLGTEATPTAPVRRDEG
jgi:phosphoribosylglycinamide formyltransferase-1